MKRSLRDITQKSGGGKKTEKYVPQSAGGRENFESNHLSHGVKNSPFDGVYPHFGGLFIPPLCSSVTASDPAIRLVYFTRAPLDTRTQASGLFPAPKVLAAKGGMPPTRRSNRGGDAELNPGLVAPVEARRVWMMGGGSPAPSRSLFFAPVVRGSVRGHA